MSVVKHLLLSREQHKKLSALEMELASAKKEGFMSKRSVDDSKKRPLLVVGIFTRFGRKNNRDAIRKAWMGSGMEAIFALVGKLTDIYTY